MSNQVVSQVPEATTHLKNVYEQSLAMLSEAKRGTGTRQSAKTCRSAVPLYVDAASLQKRAIDDAAKALATLWKVPATGRARLNR